MNESEQENVESGGEFTIPEELNIYQRIREVRREVFGIDKKGKHTHGFAFVKHDDVTAALSGLFVKWGIDREVSVVEAVRNGRVLGMRVMVAWVNVDDPKDRKAIEVYAEGVDQGVTKSGEPNVDGLTSGKAISYAVKTAELKNFCLVGDTTSDSERPGGSFQPSHSPAPAADVPPPTDDEYAVLKQLYESCVTPEELQAIRDKVQPLVLGKKLSPLQIVELSDLDSAAKARSKK